MRISDWSSDVCSSDLSRKQPKNKKIEQYPGAPGPPDPVGTGISHDPQDAGRQGYAQDQGNDQCFQGIEHEKARRDAVETEPGFQFEFAPGRKRQPRSEEHTSELQSLMRISYAVF